MNDSIQGPIVIRILLLLTSCFLILSADTVKIGVLANRGDANTLTRWTATADYLSDTIPQYRFEIIPLDFDELSEAVRKRTIDFVLTNPMYYVELESLYGISRLATLKNISSSGDILYSFGGVIFTRKESDIRTVDALKNRSFAAVDANSFGGWVMAQKELLNSGVEVGDFSEFSFLGSHDKVVIAVADGSVDAGTVRTDTLERMAAEKLVDPAQFRILAAKQYENFPFRVSTALYPEWPFATLSSTSDTLADRVLVALLNMPGDSPAARNAQVAGWTIPLDYSKVHNLLAELELGPYLAWKNLSPQEIYDRYTWWVYGISGVLLLMFSVLVHIFRLNRRLREKQQKIEALNSGLERKIHMRTLELEKMVSYEKYLKDILLTIAEVNEKLVLSPSIEAVIQGCMDILTHHEHYQKVWMGLHDENILHMARKSSGGKVFEAQRYTLSDHDASLPFVTIGMALENRETLIKKMPEDASYTLGKERHACHGYWLMVIPLRVAEEDAVIGYLSVFSDRDHGFESEERKMLENLSTDISMALHAIKQQAELDEMEIEKISNYEETIFAFVNIIEQRDSYTAGHTLRVAQYSRLIAMQMGIDEDQILTLEKAAVLHDIGKVVTPDSILLKPGHLSSLEYELIKQHAEAGYRMLSQIDMYKDLAEIIRFHHARYDGTGYPKTTPEDPDAIPMLSHILAVADTFDAMTTNRIYKPRKSTAEAIDEIRELSGSQFHPDVAEAAANALKEVEIEATTQMPESDLEKRRFAYFFLDSLTDLYNEQYLNMMLNEDEHPYHTLFVVTLNGFAAFNEKMGWDEGNRFLKTFANQLQKAFHDALVFRYHGEKFVLLFKTDKDLNAEDIMQIDALAAKGIEAELHRYNLDEVMPVL